MQNKQCHRAAIMSWEMILNDWFKNQISDTSLQKYSFLHHWFEDKKARFYALKIDLHLIYSA